MNSLRAHIRRCLRARLCGDGGFTLVEIIIAVSLLGLITGVATASLLTATAAARSSTEHSHQSSDAQLISAFLVKDAQAAGGSNPTTGQEDPSLGVFYVNGAACDPVPGLTAQFRWIDRGSSGVHTNAASYLLDTATHRLSRRLCRDGVASGDLLLAGSVQSVSPSCVPSLRCPGLPDVVKFQITETAVGAATAFSYELRAQLRSQAQTQPTSLNSGSVPLMALGGGGCPPSGSFLNVNGSSSLVVQLGGAIVNSGGGGCNSMNISGAGSYNADSTSILSPGACTGSCPSPINGYTAALADPLAGLPLPPGAGDCGLTVGNPVPVAGVYQPGVYKNNLLITPPTTAIFDPGPYVFCAGLDIRGTVDAQNVLFYVAGGSLSVAATASVSIGSQLSGPWASVSVWLTTADPVVINGGAGIDSYKGTIYAPLAVVNISGGTNLQIGSVIAYAINLVGGGYTTFGPGVTITTPSLGTAVIGSSFILPMVAQAGVGSYKNWTATGLPAGLAINATSGVISGTALSGSTGSYVVTVGVTDSSTPVNRTTSRRYDTPSSWLTVGGGALKISTPAVLLDATRGWAYSAPIVATGGVGTYTWSSTPLPTGLSLNTSSGLISGTPTSLPGSYPITVTVSDGTTATDSLPYTLVVNSPPLLGFPLLLPDTTVGANYLALSSATGGSLPLTWTVANQPAGIFINSLSGLLSSTPALLTTAGNYPNVIITVTDRNGAVASKSLPLKVNVAPSITAPATPTLPGWAVGTAYPSTTMTATGGTGSYAWSWTAPTLPPGLTINSGSGVISGTPTTAGTYGSIAVRVTDSVGVSVTGPYSITITGALSITAPTNLPNWDAGAAYPTTTPSGGGGSGGYVWSSSTLPPGLVIDSATGAITGTPTTAGPYPAVVLRMTDSNGVIATRSYSMTVYSPLAFTGPGSLRNWVAGSAYLPQTATVTGGSGSNTWSATGLPPGLALSPAGVLSGTPSPTSPGTYNAIILTVNDGAGGGFNIGPYAISIFPALGINTGGVPAAGVKDLAYIGSLSPIGGSGTFSWSASGLPAGVTLSTAGVLSGSPGAVGPYTVNFTLTDNATGGTGGPPASITVPFTITINTPLAWSGALPGATARTAGFAYSRSFATSGGLSPVTWLVTGLPTGLTSSGAVISGIPTVSGPTAVTSTVTVKATDATGQFVTHSFNLTINPTLTLAPTTAPPAVAATGASISIPYTIAGGTVPYSGLSISGPSWLSVSGNVVSGTAILGTHSFTVTVTDAGGGSVSHSFSITVKPKVSSVALSNGTGNIAGKIEKGDKIVVTFSDAVNLSSICASWASGAYAQNDFTVTVADGGVANDSITLTSPTCGSSGMTLGSFNLSNTSFVGATASFGGNGGANQTSMSFSGNVLTITLGKASVSPTVVSNTATFSPLGNITSVTGTIGIDTTIKPAITGVFF